MHGLLSFSHVDAVASARVQGHCTFQEHCWSDTLDLRGTATLAHSVKSQDNHCWTSAPRDEHTWPSFDDQTCDQTIETYIVVNFKCSLRNCRNHVLAAQAAGFGSHGLGVLDIPSEHGGYTQKISFPKLATKQRRGPASTHKPRARAIPV